MAAIDIVLQKVGRPWSLPKRQKKEGDGWHDRCSTRGWKFTFSKTRCAGQERRPGVVRPRWGAYEMLKGAVVGGGGRKRAWSSVESMRRAKRESVRKFQDAKMCRRVEEFWVTTPTRCTQAQCRAQCPVPRRSLGRGHKRRGTSKSSSTFCRETVCLRRGGHRGSQRVVGEVQRNAAAILYQNPSQARQCRSIWKTTWRAARSSPCTTKEGWLAPFKHQKSWCTRRCLSKYLDHGLQITAFPPNHWLCSAKDLHVVRGQSHGEPA